MVARRKRQPRDDEPLVPHGLISQALDASQPPAENTPPIQPSPTGIEPAKRPPARILQWPRATQHFKSAAGIARSALRTVDERRKHLQISTHLTQARDLALTGTKQLRRSFAFARGILRLLDRVGSSVQLSARATRFYEIASACAQRAVGLCRVWSAQIALHSRRLTAASLHRVKEARKQVHFPPTTAPVGVRLRIRLSGFPLQARIALARARSEWGLRRESLTRNSQLWNSVALGAVSALIVMGIFATARHYAQASLPSARNSNASSTQNTSTFAPASIVPLTVKTSNHASPMQTSKPPNTSARPKPAPQKLYRATVAPGRRIHQNEDEDYVAKDTYVYYGKNPSRPTKPATD
jgi:hypothetical protein